MPRRVARLGAEHRPDLEDPLEDADHELLVELRRLRQITGPSEVVQFEHVRAGLGRRLDDLRRLDLDEPLRFEGLAEPGGRGGGDSQVPRARRMPQRQRGMVQLGGKARAQRGSMQFKRQGYVDTAQDRNLRTGQFDATRRLLVGRDRGRHFDDTALGELLRRLRHDHLTEPGGVADDQERHFFQLPYSMDPAGDGDFFAFVRGEFGGEDALHRGLPPLGAATRPQGGVGERDPRGATTPSRPLVAGASWSCSAQGCLRAPASGHHHSCRWLSRPADRSGTRSHHCRDRKVNGVLPGAHPILLRLP